MSGDRSTVRVSFLGDTSSLQRAAKQAEDSAGKVGKSFSGMKSLIGGLAIGGAVAGAFSFAKGLANDAAESAKVMRLTENVIKHTGGAAKVTAAQVSDLSTSISNKTGADDEAIQSGQNLLLTFTNIRNGVGKGNDIFNQASQAIVDMTAQMNNGEVSTTGLKASSIQLGKALNDPIKGVGALSRVGVTFDATQKKQIENFMKAGKTADAQRVILTELNKEMGGAAKAATSPAQKAQVAWGNLREELGGYVLPIFNKLATFASGTLFPAISSGIEKIGPMFSAVAKAVQVFFWAFKGESSTGEFEGNLNKINRAGLKIGDWIRNDFLPAARRFGDWIMTVAIPAVRQFAAKFWADLQPAIRQIAASFRQDILPAIQNLIGKFREAWPNIQRFLAILGQVAQFILTRVVPVIIAFYAKYLATLIRVFGQLFVAGWKVINFLIDMGKAVGNAGAAFGRFVVAVDRAWVGVGRAVVSGIGKVVGFIKELPSKVVSGLGDLGKTLWSIGTDLVQGLIEGIKAKAGEVLDTIKNFITDKIPGFIKHRLGIASPSKVTRELGQNVSEGMALGIKDRVDKVREAMQAMVDKAKQKLADIKSFAADIRSAFVQSGNVTGIDTMSQDANGNDVNGGFGALLEGLKKKAADANAFAKAMQRLRKAGLNETTLAQLREAGPDGGLGAAQNLLAGGMGGIGQVNAFTKQIAQAGGAFAEREAKAKYGVGANETLHSLNARETRIVFDLHGADDDLKKLIRKWVRQESGGNVQKAFGVA